MQKVVTTSILLCLILLSGCSSNNVIPAEQPPAFLLVPADPLELLTVETTEDIVQRAILAEAAYDALSHRFNILIAWFAPPES